MKTRMIRRRDAVLGLSATLVAVPTAAMASKTCEPSGAGRRCRSAIRKKAFAPVFAPHGMSQWCWAASIEMMFRYYGHEVSQTRIVQDAYGSIDDVPADTGRKASDRINRDWLDDQGQHFSSRLVSVFNAAAGIYNLKNADVASALGDGHPLLLGTSTHTVVLTSVDYVIDALGHFTLLSMEVFDPWPGRGKRSLLPAEMIPPPGGGLTYLARIRIGKSDVRNRIPGPY